MDPRYRIDDQIETTEGYRFIVVEITEDLYGKPEYVVRSDLDGNDWALKGGVAGVDWEYVHIPESETK